MSEVVNSRYYWIEETGNQPKIYILHSTDLKPNNAICGSDLNDRPILQGYPNLKSELDNFMVENYKILRRVKNRKILYQYVDDPVKIINVFHSSLNLIEESQKPKQMICDVKYPDEVKVQNVAHRKIVKVVRDDDLPDYIDQNIEFAHLRESKKVKMEEPNDKKRKSC